METETEAKTNDSQGTPTNPVTPETAADPTPAPELVQAAAELEALRSQLKEYQTKAEETRQAELTESQRLTEQLAQAKAEAAEAQRQAAIATANVPDELVDLIPTELERATEFLNSDRYKSLKAKVAPIGQDKDAEAKDDDKLPAREAKPTREDQLAELGNLLGGIL